MSDLTFRVMISHFVFLPPLSDPRLDLSLTTLCACVLFVSPYL